MGQRARRIQIQISCFPYSHCVRPKFNDTGVADIVLPPFPVSSTAIPSIGNSHWSAMPRIWSNISRKLNLRMLTPLRVLPFSL